MSKFRLEIGNEEFNVDLDGNVLMRVNGQAISATIAREEGTNRFSFFSNGESFSFVVVRIGDRYEVMSGGIRLDILVRNEHERYRRELARASHSHPMTKIRAPMPALVRSVSVQTGEAFASGQTLVVLEAMKMENDVRASRAGIVSKVEVTPGMTVEKDQILLTIE